MKVKIDKEFILLGQLLQILDYSSSGGESKILVKQLDIKVNGLVENRRGRKLYSNDVVEIENHQYIIE